GWSGIAFALFLGTALGFLAGLVPGIGGRIGIVLSIPVATFWDPLGGAVFLFAMHSVVHTATSIPAIAFALPSTASDAATVLDGYPLAKMGRAGEALGASLSASALGGVLGALAFLAAIPIARLLISWFGPPEFLLLAIAGLAMVALLSGRNIFVGMMVAAFGFLAAMVGLDVQTADYRFTFDLIELSNGLSLAAIIGGFFVVPEMLARWNVDAVSRKRAVSTSLRDVLAGTLVTFKHTALVIRSSLYGIMIGIMPGLGSSVSAWMSYAYAAANTKSEIPFGKGAIAGVIAPEAANNSKEGGSMVPSLFFGIPGSSSMAIMLGAFVVIGQPVGPTLLTTDIHVPLILAATVLLSNVIAIPMFFATVPHIVRLAALQREHMVPFAIAISLFAALYQSMSTVVLVQFVAASAIGIALRRVNWPRAPFLLGFIMGPLAEISFIQTSQIWGWSMFARPATIVLWLVFVFIAVRSFRQRKRTAGASVDLHDIW
ncbi:MAG: tripartite tricarboxylate transporter permease, partial [Pseudomonadota bacterium]